MVSVVVPTYNASAHLPALLKSLSEQSMKHELIIIDSESDQATQHLFAKSEVQVVRIPKASFNHGTTRNLGVQLSTYDTVVFLTQDALPASADALQLLVDSLYSRADIAMAYGRQIPYASTGIFGSFARLANYPTQSVIKTKELIPQMGIRTCSCSNSFAAYRKQELLAVGGFPSDTILGEDVSVAARLILKGKALAYCAESTVYHSHDYTVVEEFKRYFDIGVFHKEQETVLHPFTQAESEGLKYVLSEWKYLKQVGKVKLIPAQIIRTFFKYVGYKFGLYENFLPINLKRAMSMHRSFWK